MIYIGMDNGSSGAIAVYRNDKIEVIKLPIKLVQNFTKSIKFIHKIDFVELKKIFLSLKESGEQLKVLWERPFCNFMIFNTTILSMMAYQTTLDVFEELQIPYEMIDSKEWQRKLLPSGIYKTTKDKNGKPKIKADKKQLKQASIDISNRLYPYLKLKNNNESDAVLICEYLRRRELGILK